jgi:hypothetical protein
MNFYRCLHNLSVTVVLQLVQTMYDFVYPTKLFYSYYYYKKVENERERFFRLL